MPGARDWFQTLATGHWHYFFFFLGGKSKRRISDRGISQMKHLAVPSHLSCVHRSARLEERLPGQTGCSAAGGLGTSGPWHLGQRLTWGVCETGPKAEEREASIGVPFSLVWLEIDGTGLDWFSFSGQGHLFYQRTPMEAKLDGWMKLAHVSCAPLLLCDQIRDTGPREREEGLWKPR